MTRISSFTPSAWATRISPRENGRYCHQPLNELRAMYDAARRDGRLAGRAEVALSKGGAAAFDE